MGGLEQRPRERTSAEALLERLAASGLRGRGGGWFPTARKWRAVRAEGGDAVVIANGAEGEPGSMKDRHVMTRRPEAVLEGLAIAAAAIGAREGLVFLKGSFDGPAAALERAVAAGAAGALPERIVRGDDGYVTGEETALLEAIEGRRAWPRPKPPLPAMAGLFGRPTLVQNVETLARLAQLARGDQGAAGRTLVTRHLQRHRTTRTDVLEISLGVPLGDILPVDDHVRAVLIGGYHGTWVPVAVARDLTLDRAGLEPVGAALGAGVLAALPTDRCGLRETARVVSYLAASSAGQCGPCLNGLPRIAAGLQVLARPGAAPRRLVDDLWRWCGLLPDRGACRHPDGSVRLVASALDVFGSELRLHASGRCSATTTRPFLPVKSGAR